MYSVDDPAVFSSSSSLLLGSSSGGGGLGRSKSPQIDIDAEMEKLFEKKQHVEDEKDEDPVDLEVIDLAGIKEMRSGGQQRRRKQQTEVKTLIQEMD